MRRSYFIFLKKTIKPLPRLLYFFGNTFLETPKNFIKNYFLNSGVFFEHE